MPSAAIVTEVPLGGTPAVHETEIALHQDAKTVMWLSAKHGQMLIETPQRWLDRTMDVHFDPTQVEVPFYFSSGGQDDNAYLGLDLSDPVQSLISEVTIEDVMPDETDWTISMVGSGGSNSGGTAWCVPGTSNVHQLRGLWRNSNIAALNYSTAEILSNSTFNTGAWYLAQWSYRRSDGSVSLLKNGVQVVSSTIPDLVLDSRRICLFTIFDLVTGLNVTSAGMRSGRCGEFIVSKAHVPSDTSYQNKLLDMVETKYPTLGIT
jgi:hypothetical protein